MCIPIASLSAVRRVTATVFEVSPSSTSLTTTEPDDSDTLYTSGSNLTVTSNTEYEKEFMFLIKILRIV